MSAPPDPEKSEGPTNGQVGRARSSQNVFREQSPTNSPSHRQARFVDAPLRFPGFGANGLYPGRRGAPSPIQPDQVLTAMMFLRMFTPSYYLKHVAERWGAKVGLCSYVSNGALILAAMELGLVVRPCDDWPNPNCRIGISKRDLRRITGVS
jgi:hypothetical protein